MGIAVVKGIPTYPACHGDSQRAKRIEWIEKMARGIRSDNRSV